MLSKDLELFSYDRYITYIFERDKYVFVYIQGTEAQKALALVRSLEHAVARKKGKGTKSRNVVKLIKVNMCT